MYNQEYVQPRPQATPRFYLVATEKTRLLQDKIWDWPRDKAKVYELWYKHVLSITCTYLKNKSIHFL